MIQERVIREFLDEIELARSSRATSPATTISISNMPMRRGRGQHASTRHTANLRRLLRGTMHQTRPLPRPHRNTATNSTVTIRRDKVRRQQPKSHPILKPARLKDLVPASFRSHEASCSAALRTDHDDRSKCAFSRVPLPLLRNSPSQPKVCLLTDRYIFCGRYGDRLPNWQFFSYAVE